ncbi:MAG: hypothetical protein PHE27_06815 [Alphaproteobacteria bacterium]|nr:hypothetical protein [Alphaproteobacteria bacterium]
MIHDDFAEMEIGRLMAESPIDYVTVSAELEDKCFVAGTTMGAFAVAQGPFFTEKLGTVSYLGTCGVEPCTALGVVTRMDEEACPRVSVGHFHALNDIGSSVDALLDKGRHLDGDTVFYVVSGDKDNMDVVDINTLADIYGAHACIDVKDGVVRELMIDLETGKPVDPASAGLVSWILKNEKDTVDEVVRDALTLEKKVARFDFNLSHGIPETFGVYPKRSTGLAPETVSDYREKALERILKHWAGQSCQP